MRKLPEGQAPGVALDDDGISVASETSNASHSSLANQRRKFVKKASTKRMVQQRPRRTSVSDTVSKLSRVSASRRESVSTRLFGFVSNSLGSIGSSHGKKPVKEEYTYLQRLVIEMRDSLDQFDDENDVDVTDDQLENWAIIIYESMSAPSRTFHGVQHVFAISEGADPIQKVSAFFHDVIYYSIDGGLSPAQEKVLHGLVKEGEDKTVSLCEAEFDEATRLVIDMFGFSLGQTLNPFSGLNEFLSAALAIRCLKDTLSLSSLAKIAACIEATIPFRAPDEDGRTCSDLLFDRFKNVNEKMKLGMGEGEIIESTQRAADLANRDVANFSTPERAVFLSNTWNLLPESNISLRHTRCFRIGDFTLALKKMSNFFSFLNAENIYTSFEGVPSAKKVSDMTQRAKENIEVATKYMHCKLLSISVLYALAEKTGGDAPIALFLGDLPSPKSISPAIEDYITISPPARGVQLDKRVFALLRDGREGESEFDIKNSPLAAYLYALMGDEGLQKALTLAAYPMTTEDAKKLLDVCPPEAVVKIATSCAEIALTRASQLQKIAALYSS